MTPFARNALTQPEADRVASIESELGVRVGALRSVRNREWIVSVDGQGKRVRLRAKGPLAAIIDGAIEDWQAAA